MTLIGKAKPYRRFTLIKRGSKIKNKTLKSEGAEEAEKSGQFRIPAK